MLVGDHAAERMEMSGDFVKLVLEAIHSESVRQQMVIMERAKSI